MSPMGKMYRVDKAPPAKTKVDKKQNKEILKIKKALKADINYVSFQNTQQTEATIGAGFVVPLTYVIPQGDAHGQRDGNAVGMESLKLTIKFEHTENAADQRSVIFRAILFRDMQPTPGTDPTGANLLENVTIESQLNSLTMGNNKRFRVLFDRLYGNKIGLPFSSATDENVVNTSAIIKYSKNFKSSIDLPWITDAATSASQGKGHYFLYVMSNYVLAGATIVQTDWQIKFSG